MTETAEKSKSEAKSETLGFEAEVAKLLHLMVHSVYSDREIFLRELISNAADACDKLRYEAVTDASLIADDPEFKVTVTLDSTAKTMTVSDNGIGMNRDDLVSHLGTIARSGTQQFAEALAKGDATGDVNLIGQFGVGFYSAFMVADQVTVTTRRAGDEAAWQWHSDGLGEYTIDAGERTIRGTDVVLHLKDDAIEFLETYRTKGIITRYSDHIAVPITLIDALAENDDGSPVEPETVNTGSALWTRPKSDITDENHAEFFHHVGGTGDVAHRVHYRAEGKIEYTVLLYVPETQPFDLFDPARRNRVKLYVKRVFITDDCEDLLPGYLRFLRGVVDSEDLPLNISREMLQNNPVLRQISKAVTNRVISELGKLADKQPETYDKIWDAFGPVLKEGLYEDFERRDELMKLARFRTTNGEGWTSLADYVERMKDKQSAIYYVTGPDAEAVTKSPQLEGFKAKGVEVLLLSDAVDDFWIGQTPDFDGKPFHSVTRGGSELSDIAGEAKSEEDEKDTPKDGELTRLTTLIKEVLGDAVKDVRTTDRLTDSPVCLIADDGEIDMNLQRILAANKQIANVMPKVLEVNPGHPLIKSMAERAKGEGATEALSDTAHLLLDQARIIEGEPVADASLFAQRMAATMAKGIG